MRGHGSTRVDHVIPVSHGGSNHIVNGMVLCQACHREKSRAERSAFGQAPCDARECPMQRTGEGDLVYLRRYLGEVHRRTGWSLWTEAADVEAEWLGRNDDETGEMPQTRDCREEDEF